MNSRETVDKLQQAINTRQFPVLTPEGYNPQLQAALLAHDIQPVFVPDPNRLVRGSITIATLVDLLHHRQRVELLDYDHNAPQIIGILGEYLNQIRIWVPQVLATDPFAVRAVKALAQLQEADAQRVRTRKASTKTKLTMAELLRD